MPSDPNGRVETFAADVKAFIAKAAKKRDIDSIALAGVDKDTLTHWRDTLRDAISIPIKKHTAILRELNGNRKFDKARTLADQSELLI